VNFNPETVSTDYDVCDRLYFDEISLESLLEINDREAPLGAIVSVGGQIANNLALQLHDHGVNVIGTSPHDIDRAEDRHKFSLLLDQIGVDQPPWSEVGSLSAAEEFASGVGYPVLIRPSYVLSGAAMGVATNAEELRTFLGRAAEVSPDHPVVMSKFYENTKEVEVDAVARAGKVLAMAVMEHVENAGVHSGDASLVLPPQRTYLETIRRIQRISERIAESLTITGPFNVQYLAKGTDIRVIECNLRASRSVPFVSKVCKVNFIDLAVRGMMGLPVEKPTRSFFELDYVGVKAPQFSFTRLQGADPTLGVEMASTGEVGCLGDDFDEAFLKALISVGFRFPIKRVLLSTGPLVDKVAFIDSARLLHGLGVEFYATRGTSEFLAEFGLPSTTVHWPLEKAQPNAEKLLEERGVDLVINIPKNYQETELTNDYFIRRKAVDFGIPLITNIQLANRIAEALSRKKLTDLTIKPLQAYEV
jgi:carbamoyl-phosphate synthase large subunit